MKAVHRGKGAALVILGSVACSTAGLFMHFLAAADVWTILFWRSLVGSGLVALGSLVLERRAFVRAIMAMPWAGWLAAVALAVSIIAFTPALRLTSVANVAVIYASMPLLAALLGWCFWKDKPPRKTLVAALIVLIGTAVIVGSSAFTGHGLGGDVLALAMTLSLAVLALLLRHNTGLPVMAIIAVANLLSALTALPFADPLAITSSEGAILFLFAFTQIVLGVVLFSFGAKRLPASETALIGTIEAPLAPLWLWGLTGEVPQIATFVGGAIIIAAVSIDLLSGHPGGRRGPHRRISTGLPTFNKGYPL